MATVTLHPFGAGPTRNRAIAPVAAKPEPEPRLPAFWGSVFSHEVAANESPASASAPTAVKSPALVGDLWIQIR